MIKAIIFDFGQTLVDSANGFRTAEKVAKEKIFNTLLQGGKNINQAVFLDKYRSIRKLFHDASIFSRVAIWKTVYDNFDYQMEQPLLEQMEIVYWDQIKQLTKPFPETLAVLEALTQRYQLGIISNTQGQKTEKNHRMALFPEIETFFATIIIAGESGIPPKPDSQSFELCLKQMKLKPSEAIYVGDDYRNDVCGSADAGLKPVWLQHRSVQRNWPEHKTTAFIIEDLRELLTIEY
ncbi:MAG: HAD family hydrolase [Deltaproteobacteria bacterium]|jgi:HAD superfamily hydrolase (TIGR01549 family)|nr:HAD family hydrolase [Deltaproteobacteria bacterium]